MTVRQLEMLKPFAAAVAFAQERVPMTRAEFDTLTGEMQRRAFTIAGLARRRTIEEAYRYAIQATEEGWTREQLGAELRRVAAEREGILLSRGHTDLIFQNHHTAVVAAGRHDQLMAVRGARPYWRYPLVPNDEKLSEICRPLLGFIARWDHPAWQHIFPPNHHRDRHKNVRSLTEAEARELGIYEGDEQPYPFLGGRRILPDPGFDRAPGLGRIDDELFRAHATELGAQKAGGRTAAAYDLAPLAGMPRTAAAKMPARGIALTDRSTAADAWDAVRELLEVPETFEVATLIDALGDGVMVSRGSVDRILASVATRPEASLPLTLLRPAIEDPLEVWIVARARGEETVFHKRYLAAFYRGTKKPPLVAVIEESPDAWLMGARVLPAGAAELEALRRGRLAYRRGGAN